MVSSPKSNLLSRYSSPLRSPPVASQSPLRSPTRASTASIMSRMVPTSPRNQVFTDSEYVANRISIAAKDVEIRTLKAELAATQHALDNARSDSIIRDTEMQDRETMLQSDLRRRQSEHEGDMHSLLSEKERVAAAVSVQREREHRETINAINHNHGQMVHAVERQHDEHVHKVLADQKGQLEADYRRALDAAEDEHRRREEELRMQMQASNDRRCTELREQMSVKGIQREQEINLEFSKKRANELDLLESAHKREMSNAATVGENRLSKNMDDLNLDWQRKIDDANMAAAVRQQNAVAALDNRQREESSFSDSRHREEVAAMKRLHSEDCSELESHIAATRRVKEEEKNIALHLQQSELNEYYMKDATETDLKHKSDLYEMYQSCKDEVHTTRHRTLLEVGASPRTHYLSPRYYSADTPLDRLNTIVTRREIQAGTSPLRSPSPYRSQGRSPSPYRSRLL